MDIGKMGNAGTMVDGPIAIPRDAAGTGLMTIQVAGSQKNSFASAIWGITVHRRGCAVAVQPRAVAPAFSHRNMLNLFANYDLQCQSVQPIELSQQDNCDKPALDEMVTNDV